MTNDELPNDEASVPEGSGSSTFGFWASVVPEGSGSSTFGYFVIRHSSFVLCLASWLVVQGGAVAASKPANGDPEHWSWQPLERPQLPRVADAAWPRNPVDRFVLAQLEQQGTEPSREADRRTLIRRLTFDLWGLPPRPADVDAFVADVAPQAYGRLVNRLLASPRYGERWARHWLDVVRYGESDGFQHDWLRSNAWRYRQWVIDALNQDMPYDQFARWQLAGDVLQPNDPAAMAATGFLVAGAYDWNANQSRGNAKTGFQYIRSRQEEMEDIVGTVGQTLLGLTVQCARCHDHRTDPIGQEDYYRLSAALAGVRHGQRDIGSDQLRDQLVKEAAVLQNQIGTLRQELLALIEPIRQQIFAERPAYDPTATPPPEPVARWDFDRDFQDQIGQLHAAVNEGPALENGHLSLRQSPFHLATEPLAQDLTAKTLEVCVTPGDSGQLGDMVMAVQTFDGKTFDALVLGGSEPGHWNVETNHFYSRAQRFRGPPETVSGDGVVHVAVVFHEDGTVTAYRNGQSYGNSIKAPACVGYKTGEARIIFSHVPPGATTGKFKRAQLFDRALSPQEVAASAGVTSQQMAEDEILARLDSAAQQRYKQVQFEISHLESQLFGYAQLPVPPRAALEASPFCITHLYTVTPEQPEPTFLLDRGDPNSKIREVSSGGIAALLGVEADFGLPTDAPDAPRRIKLAEWVTHRDNPLFARVIVNRLWHYHFGIGLVDTPSDFGASGNPPSHPHLLDWLAQELVCNGWSLKHLHRTIVTSATYRQASTENEAAELVDGDNRLLWKKSRLRLEAEAVRDAVLLVCDQLNSKIGGPGYHDFHVSDTPMHWFTPSDFVGHTFNRRSIYRTWARAGWNPLLTAFDCPDPSTITPRRAVTTTPLQALSLMNSSFVLRMADHFSERVERDAGGNLSRQIARVYQLAYGRGPTRDESALAEEFIGQHGLPAMCRVLFNSNEFVHVD